MWLLGARLWGLERSGRFGFERWLVEHNRLGRDFDYLRLIPTTRRTTASLGYFFWARLVMLLWGFAPFDRPRGLAFKSWGLGYIR